MDYIKWEESSTSMIEDIPVCTDLNYKYDVLYISGHGRDGAWRTKILATKIRRADPDRKLYY